VVAAHVIPSIAFNAMRDAAGSTFLA